MAQIPAAKISPRIEEEDGSLRWYYQDTFKLEITIKLIADDETIIPLVDGDTLIVRFYSKGGSTIHDFEFNIFEDNKVVLNFTNEISNKFRPGTYYYNAIHIRNYRRTIAHKNLAVVE